MEVVEGRVVDPVRKTHFPGRVTIENGRVADIREVRDVPAGAGFLMPGFIDAHVHVESSLLVPSEFARLAVCSGTVGTVSDPHEIANVLGVAGVEFMLADAARTPFRFAFGAPSCVPATDPSIETAGARLGLAEVEGLLDRPEILYLSEVMNFPAVVAGRGEYGAMIRAAAARGKPADGHFPGGRGEDVRRYAAAGITTDHECFTLEEGREKAAAGLRILIREGSAAHNFEALHPLLGEFPGRVMFCSDDKHPHELARGHINGMVARAVALGYPLWEVLHAACVAPVEHYRMPVGLLRPGDPADFIRVRDLESFAVEETWIDGVRVARSGVPLLPSHPVEPVNRFEATPVAAGDLRLEAGGRRVRAIVARDGQLVTGAEWVEAMIRDGVAVADPSRDLLKIAVLNRYEAGVKPAVGFVRGFGLTRGALASSVGHDSHNVVAVGTSDEALAEAINAVVGARGGLAVVGPDPAPQVLPLPVAGLMSDGEGFAVARKYEELHAAAGKLGGTLHDPLMMLSFLALPVIPELKMTDKGLFDVGGFQHVGIFGA